jgi:hypothetical protein
MSLRLSLLSLAFPKKLRLRMLDELAQVTARGFETKLPGWRGASFDSRVTEYALFTAREAGVLVDAGDEAAIAAARDRLHAGARQLGERLRRRLGVRDVDEAFAAFQLLYRQIGIEVIAGPPGDIRVRRCFFARHYTESVCGIVSALDQGLVAGLFAGALLEFQERLTGGGACCRATLSSAGPGCGAFLRSKGAET